MKRGLTETDLTRIVKRVINKERLIKESLTISDIELDVSYGNLMTKVDGEDSDYCLFSTIKMLN